jgi:hypothetical protein
MQTMPRSTASATTTGRPKTSTYTPPTSRIEDMKPRALPDQKQLHKQMSDMMQQFTKPATTSRIQLYKPGTGAPQFEHQQQSFNPMATRKLTNESNHDIGDGGGGSNTMMFNVKNKNQK